MAAAATPVNVASNRRRSENEDSGYSEDQDTVTLKEMNLTVRNLIEDEDLLALPSLTEMKKRAYLW